MKLKALIIDDEPLALEVTEVFLQQIPSVEIVGMCDSAVDALSILNRQPVDVIFLDIEMPALNGLDFIKAINHKPRIVIISAYRNFAVESYELDVVDYLVKPYSFHRLVQAIQKVTELISITDKNVLSTAIRDPEKNGAHIIIKVDKKIVKVDLDSILYIESLKDYVRVKTLDEDYITYCTLTYITEQLPGEKFIRAHRSHTIAIDKIDQIEGNHAVIRGNYIHLARNRKAEVIEKFSNQNYKI